MIDFLTALYLAFLKYFSYLTVGYFVAINVIYLILIALSFYHIRRQLKEKNVFGLQGLFSSNLYSPISILAPAFNEESTIVASVKSLLQLRYPNYEVIVVNDGSKDRTMDVLIDQFKLKRVKRYVPLILNHKPIKAIYKSTVYPDLIVVDKENGRKADALNAGINVCRNDLFCAIDADCVLEPDVLQNMLKTFIEDETTIAVGGIIRVANDCIIEGNEIKEIRFPKKFLPRIQVVEYLRAFLFGRVGWDYLDSLLIISGAFGIFDRNAVLKVGGYLHDTVGEDMELVVRLHKYHRERKIPYRVRFLPEPVCWTEVPEDANVLARQRNRWQRGLADTLYRHRDMFFNPKYGRLGFFAVPFFFIFELLSPIIELLGWLVLILAILFGAVNLHFALIFLSAAVLLGMVLSISSILCEEFTYRRYPRMKDIFLMSLYAFFENFGFRQVHMWWRLMGIKDFLIGNKEWGAMTRKGLGNQSVLENLKTNSKEEILSVLDEADYQIGDHLVDTESYIQSLDSNITSVESEKESKSRTTLWLKLLVGIMFIVIIGLSLWPYLQINKEPDVIMSNPEIESTVTDTENLVSIQPTPDNSAINIEFNWNDPVHYIISEHSFTSEQAIIHVLQYLDDSNNIPSSPQVALRSGANNSFWSVGFGAFQNYHVANNFAIQLGMVPSSYEIVRKVDYTPEEIISQFTFNESSVGTYIILETIETDRNSEARLNFWRIEMGENVQLLNNDSEMVAIGPFSALEDAELCKRYIEMASGREDFRIEIIN